MNQPVRTAAALARAPKLDLTVAKAREEVILNPLMLLPPEWRVHVFSFWAKFASILRSQLDLAATLRDWILDDDLTLEECLAAFGSLTRPARRASIQFAGQVLAELAKDVAEIVGRRNSIEAQEKRRVEAEEGENRRKALQIANWTPGAVP